MTINEGTPEYRELNRPEFVCPDGRLLTAMSFENRRKRFLKAMQRATGSNGIAVVIPMRKCQDVPRFLKRLDKFEKAGRKSKLQLARGVFRMP